MSPVARTEFTMPTQTGEPFACDLTGVPVIGRIQSGKRVIVFPPPFADLEVFEGKPLSARKMNRIREAVAHFQSRATKGAN